MNIYKSEFKSLNGKSYSLLITKSSYSGLMQERFVNNVELRTKKGKDSFVDGTSLSVSFICEDNMEFVELINVESPMDVRAYLYSEGRLIFSGYLLIDTYTETYESDNHYSIDIDFVDCVSLLKSINFRPVGEDTSVFMGIDSIFNTMSNVFSNIVPATGDSNYTDQIKPSYYNGTSFSVIPINSGVKHIKVRFRYETDQSEKFWTVLIRSGSFTNYAWVAISNDKIIGSSSTVSNLILYNVDGEIVPDNRIIEGCEYLVVFSMDLTTHSSVVLAKSGSGDDLFIGDIWGIEIGERKIIQPHSGIAIEDNIVYNVSNTNVVESNNPNVIISFINDFNRNLYISSSTVLPEIIYTYIDNCMFHLGVNMRNFYDEGYEPMSCMEVISHFSKILGLHIKCIGNNVYMYDRASIGDNIIFQKYTNGVFQYKSITDANLLIGTDNIVNEGNELETAEINYRGKVSHSLFYLENLFEVEEPKPNVPKENFEDVTPVTDQGYVVTDQSFKQTVVTPKAWIPNDGHFAEYPHGVFPDISDPTHPIVNPFNPQFVGSFDEDLANTEPTYYFRWVPSGGMGYGWTPQLEEMDYRDGETRPYDEALGVNNFNTCFPVFTSKDFTFNSEDGESVGSAFIQGDGNSVLALDAKGFLSAGNPYTSTRRGDESYSYVTYHTRVWLMPEIGSEDYNNAWCLINVPYNTVGEEGFTLNPDADNDDKHVWKDKGWSHMAYKWAKGSELVGNESLRLISKVAYDDDGKVQVPDSDIDIRKEWIDLSSGPFKIPSNVSGILRIQILNGTSRRIHRTPEDYLVSIGGTSWGQIDYAHLKDIKINQYDMFNDVVENPADTEYHGYNADKGDFYADTQEKTKYVIETSKPYGDLMGAYGVSKILNQNEWRSHTDITRNGLQGSFGEVLLQEMLTNSSQMRIGLNVSCLIDDYRGVFAFKDETNVKVSGKQFIVDEVSWNPLTNIVNLRGFEYFK